MNSRDGQTPAAPDDDPAAGWFAHPAAALASTTTALLRDRLSAVVGLPGQDAQTIFAAANRCLLDTTQLRLNRALLLELHAASLGGRLGAQDGPGRWQAFLELAASPAFRGHLDERYPTLRRRIDAAGANLVGAATALAERLVADRPRLARLTGGPAGDLRSLALGAGDPHRGGHTVARLDFTGGTVMYKPRPLDADRVLDDLLAAALPGPGRIRTPRTVTRDGYGWTEFVPHRYCADDAETADFYRGLGRWLAVMRLVGGIDLHADNIVANGPIPVVVDAETLFAPEVPPTTPDGDGAAAAAARILRRTVLRTGLLPTRVGLLSGIERSAAGGLPGEQPELSIPTIVEGGTDGARLAGVRITLPAGRNHPSREPRPERYWQCMAEGFLELSGRLRRMDRDGELADALKPFLGLEFRQVVRSTRVYGDIREMLWHPSALHEEAKAVELARAALRRHARANPVAPCDQAGIDAEIAELLDGDTPVFTFRLDPGQLADAVDGWRAADLELEAGLIRFALAGVFRDHHAKPRGAAETSGPVEPGRGQQRGHGPKRAPGQHGRGDGVEPRRLALAAAGIRALRDTAIHGRDGSATWIGPVLGGAGWAVRALDADLYSGQSGVTVCLAGYLHEARAGRAEPVSGLADLVDGALATLIEVEDQGRASLSVGALTGLAGQVWTWITLARLLGDGALLDRAEARAALLSRRIGRRSEPSTPRSATDPTWSDGLSGAVRPLLDLAEATGRDAWLAAAGAAGDRLAAQRAEPGGGFARGTPGIGWSLYRLAAGEAGDDADRARWRSAAARAFDGPAAAHLNQASPQAHAADPAWCTGAAGIGLAACDIYSMTGERRHLDLVRRAAAAVDRARSDSLGRGRSLCHGACGEWEFRQAARRLAPDLPVPAQADAEASLLDRLEQAAPAGIPAVEAGAPGLMTGIAGTVLTLLRMHPEHALGTPLLLAVRPPPRGA